MTCHSSTITPTARRLPTFVCIPPTVFFSPFRVESCLNKVSFCQPKDLRQGRSEMVDLLRAVGLLESRVAFDDTVWDLYDYRGIRGYWFDPPPRSHPPLSTLASLALSSSHGIALRPSPFHRRPRTSSISPPIASITSCRHLQALRRQARPRFPFVSLSRASFIVLNSRFASIRLVRY